MVLAEIYILFEAITFLLFLKGMDEPSKILYPMLAMGFFFALAVSSFAIESIFQGSTVTIWLGVGINFGLGLISFVFAVFNYMNSLRELEG